MTIAIPPQPVKAVKFYGYIHPSYSVKALLARLWWHTHAYATVFGIMVLTILSLSVLYVHAQLYKALPIIYQGFQAVMQMLFSSIKYRRQ